MNTDCLGHQVHGKKLQENALEAKNHTPTVVWLYGDYTQVDMISKVMHHQKDRKRWIPVNMEYVHHYREEPIVILWDITLEACRFGFLLRALDKHTVELDSQFKRVEWHPEYIIIVARKHPKECYHHLGKQHPEHLVRLLNLIDRIIECTPETIDTVTF